MSWLLDTNVLSETTRPQPSAVVLAWLAAQPVDECFLSVITVGELWRGALLLSAGKKRKALLAWIQDDILPGFAGRIVPIDIAVWSDGARCKPPPNGPAIGSPSWTVCWRLLR